MLIKSLKALVLLLALLAALALLQSQEDWVTQGVIWAIVCVPSVLATLLLGRILPKYRVGLVVFVVLQLAAFLPLSAWMVVFPVDDIGITLMVLPVYQFTVFLLGGVFGVIVAVGKRLLQKPQGSP